MEFSREDYIKDGLLVQMARLAIGFAVLIVCGIGMLRERLSITSEFLWMAIFALLFLIVFLYGIIPSALKYTWPLLWEGEADTTVVQGELQQIVPVTHSPRYATSWPSVKVMRAVLLHIDGRELYCMSAEGLTVGKQLIVRYLPRSRVVLSWRTDSDDYSPFDM